MSAGAPRLPDALGDVLADARRLGFLGPGPIEPHLAHALAFARVVERTSGATLTSVLDLGSGGGLPGLVLAVVWPAITVTLLDAHQRRTAFLADAARHLGVSTRVQVVEGRAEAIGHRPELRGRVGVVVARSFGRPAVTAECAAAFLEVGGALVVSEPPVDAAPVASPGARPRGPRGDRGRWSETGLRALGMGPARPVVDEFHFVVVHQLETCPEGFPRRVGIPAKRPLF